jgi:hypothetical protein
MFQNLVLCISYFTFNTGEKFASIYNTSKSVSLSFKSSILKYQIHFSTLISISRDIQSLSIFVIYKSLFTISIHALVFISQAVTTHALFFVNFNHSIQASFFSIIRSLKFNIMSIILSFIHGIVVYSWLIHLIFIHVTLVQGMLDNKTLLKEFPIVIPYHLGNGPIINLEEFIPTSCSKILGTQISLCMICMLLEL